MKDTSFIDGFFAGWFALIALETLFGIGILVGLRL